MLISDMLSLGHHIVGVQFVFVSFENVQFLSVHVGTLLEFLGLPRAVSQELKGFCPSDSVYQNPFATLEGVYPASGSTGNACHRIQDAARLFFCAEVPI